MADLTAKKFSELYNKLPKDLQDALFAEITGENIVEICERYRIPEANDFISDKIGDVYLGLLPPGDFFDALKEFLKDTDKNELKQIVHEINRFLLYPVKDSLGRLYDLEFAPPAKPSG